LSAPVSGSKQVATGSKQVAAGSKQVARPATRTNTACGVDDEKTEFMSDRHAAVMDKERAPSQRGLLHCPSPRRRCRHEHQR